MKIMSFYLDLKKKDNRIALGYCKLLKLLELSLDTLEDVRKKARRGSYRLTLGVCLLSFSLLTVRQYDGYAASQAAPEIDLSAISRIESSNNPRAIGDGGRSLGLFQLSHYVVDDYNRHHNTRYLREDALDSKIAYKMAAWYLNVEIPRLLASFKLPVTPDNVLIAYNAGIRAVLTGKTPASTKAYLKKYGRITS